MIENEKIEEMMLELEEKAENLRMLMEDFSNITKEAIRAKLVAKVPTADTEGSLAILMEEGVGYDELRALCVAASERIGGVTGDVFGALIETTECAVLAVCCLP